MGDHIEQRLGQTIKNQPETIKVGFLILCVKTKRLINGIYNVANGVISAPFHLQAYTYDIN